ncbi:hypothetical protein [Sphingomonas sp. R86520]|uniref:hypothetical protein n=1 Tax=Sphingomonas sp. R86520 TaxID=3093859 RepID=UPI0036D28353
MIAAFILLASAPVSGCDLAHINGARAVHEALGQRAVKIMAAAAATSPKADALLSDLVDESASFNLIIGDVGSPNAGIAGARSIAQTIKADEFRYLGWDYMDLPADGCGKQLITVDFINNHDQRISQMEFTFQQARLIAAKGWQHSFESGPLPAFEPDRNGR